MAETLTLGEYLRTFTAKAQAVGLTVQALGDGDLNSEVAIIAEAPGYQEVAMHRPLVGASGKYLWEALRKYNITRMKCFVTNVVKRQLTEDIKGRKNIDRQELEHWEALLRWELSQMPNLKYILILGDYALHAVMKERGITNWRGTVLPYTLGDGKVVTVAITHNPAFILRSPQLEVVFKIDIQKFHLMLEGKASIPEVNIHIAPSFTEAMQWMDKMQDERLDTALDIETANRETTCVGFANSVDEAMCIPFRTKEDNFYSTDEEMKLIRRMDQLCSDTRMRFVWQNGMYDASCLWFKDAVEVHGGYFDTMLAHHTLYPALPHNLAFMLSQYTFVPFYKDEIHIWRQTGQDMSSYWTYNGRDCCHTLRLVPHLTRELQQQGLYDFFMSHVMRLQPELIRMTVGGVKCDLSLKAEITRELDKTVQELRDDFDARVVALTGDPDRVVNPRSRTQMAKLLFDDLKLVGRGTSVNAENRDRILAHPRTSDEARGLITVYDKFTTEAKFASVYADSEVDDDGRFRGEYKQTGTVSAPGRLSSSETPWETGGNLQNQPIRAQQMFIADEGYCFVYFDLSQAEARIVAYRCEVEGLIHNFELQASQGIDVHRANASRIFGLPYDEIPAEDWVIGPDGKPTGEPTKRYLGKRCVHGLNYRMQAPKLAAVCNIPLKQAEDAWNKYHRAFPEIREGWREYEQIVKEKHMQFNAFGRRQLFLGKATEEMLESIVAFYPQSTIGDAVNRVIYLAHAHRDWPRYRDSRLAARVALNIHDACIAVCRLDDAAVVGRVLKEAAETPILVKSKKRTSEVIIPAELKMSQPGPDGIHRWSTLKKVKVIA